MEIILCPISTSEKSLAQLVLIVCFACVLKENKDSWGEEEQEEWVVVVVYFSIPILYL